MESNYLSFGALPIADGQFKVWWWNDHKQMVEWGAEVRTKDKALQIAEEHWTKQFQRSGNRSIADG